VVFHGAPVGNFRSMAGAVTLENPRGLHSNTNAVSEAGAAIVADVAPGDYGRPAGPIESASGEVANSASDFWQDAAMRRCHHAPIGRTRPGLASAIARVPFFSSFQRIIAGFGDPGGGEPSAQL
jgi:hypothetical protein